MAARQAATEKQMTYFAAAICGLMAIFVLLHWTRFLFSKASKSSKSLSWVSFPFGAVTRYITLLPRLDIEYSRNHILTLPLGVHGSF
jgi:hypothetical protein